MHTTNTSNKVITKNHGLGGKYTEELIREIILPEFKNPYLSSLDDAAVLPMSGKEIIFTTDSFVVSPHFFPGGNIGKLSIAGTVNDIIAQGGIPRFISMGLILEEGLPFNKLKAILHSAAKEAKKAGVQIVCGDTKVVDKGFGDGIYINTAGIGEKLISFNNTIKKDDEIVVLREMGDHGAAIFQARNELLEDDKKIKSDCEALVKLTKIMPDIKKYLKFMRDPTRGGVAEILMELASFSKKDIEIYEKELPFKKWVKGLSHITGMDPLYFACEGNMVFVMKKGKGNLLIEKLNTIGYKKAKLIGIIGGKNKINHVILHTIGGGECFLSPTDIAQLPRIC